MREVFQDEMPLSDSACAKPIINASAVDPESFTSKPLTTQTVHFSSLRRV